MSKLKVNFWADAALFVLFVLLQAQDATGVDVHQWIGFAALLLVAIHLVLHWAWIKSTIRRGPRSLQGVVRRNFRLNLLLALSAFLAFFSGLAISPLLWNDQAIQMHRLHHGSAMLTLILVVVHLVLHRKWIVQNVKRHILGLTPASPRPAQRLPR
ncbi:MAG TPA: hypothetical protein PKD09_14660 [Aggregatilinea sp.]|uniref:hypothetical protein n=1 Tax=Aggregatilinea sp. TaxID=2806333 RepID=UPI002D0FBBF4|nr:hypothetical protein [Aggregatilinea sp.]HML22890.1 hypothetical protein [Aggregatilinea sp.]